MKKKIISLLLILLILPISVKAEEGYLYDVMEQKFNDGLAVKEYTGEHKDSMSGNDDKKIYHFYAELNFDAVQVLDSNNVIFGEQCWQILRTTDNGGVRLIYNGEAENNQCLGGRGTPFGFGYNQTFEPENGTYYSTDIQYDKENNTFKLSGNIKKSDLNDDTFESLIGLFTCNSTVKEDGCLTPYYIMNSYIRYSDSKRVLSGKKFEKSNAPDAIGIATFSSENSLAAVGYMYKSFPEFGWDRQYSNTTQIYGADYIYENNQYKLVDTRVGLDNYHHYSCASSDPEATCEELKYYFYRNTSYGNHEYTVLKDGKSLQETINEMLYAEDINQKESNAKKLVESWYQIKLIDFEDNLDKDAIYCGDRTISDYGPLNPNGGDVSSDGITYFKSGRAETDNLYCSNINDRFSVNNKKAPLKYPVALATSEELRLLQSNRIITASGAYQTMSPGVLKWGDCVDNMIYANYSNSEGVQDSRVTNDYLLRPVVTLKPNTKYISGDGSATSPFIIKPVIYSSIAVLDEEERGNVDVQVENVEKIEEDSIVRFSINPKLGFVLGAVKITDEEGNEIQFTQTGNSFEFVMPSTKVNIIPSYEALVVINPETGQVSLLFLTLILLLSGIIGVSLYKKQINY